MNFRDRHGDANFYDLPYDRFVEDPVAGVRRAYEHFGETLSETAETAMRAYLKHSPKGRYGTHRYAIEDFGLCPGEIRERFADYTKRCDIPEEA